VDELKAEDVVVELSFKLVGDKSPDPVTTQVIGKQSAETIEPGEIALEVSLDLHHCGNHDATERDRANLLVKMTSVLDGFQQRTANVEGVCVQRDLLTPELAMALNAGIDRFATSQHEKDYHPGSNEMVRDFVHPGLYPFVRNRSPFTPSVELPELPPLSAEEWEDKYVWEDMFRRPFEDSQFQWLPTYVDYSQGRWRYRGEINNLSRAGNQGLYESLEQLLTRAMPMLQAAVGYARALTQIPEEEKEDKYASMRLMDEDDERESPMDLTCGVSTEAVERAHFDKSESLQVITKIVEYELQPGEEYEGVWHVEGMLEFFCGSLASQK
jgi:hypothetical protein